MSSKGSLQEQLRAVASQWGVSVESSEQADSKPKDSAMPRPARAPRAHAKSDTHPRRHRPNQTSTRKSADHVHRATRPSDDQPAAAHKPKWLEYAQYGVELLKAYFPQAFKEMNAVVPLKKGIKEDLVKRLGSIDTIVIEDKACMVKSLAYYVNTASYHRAMVNGVQRIDLDGVLLDAVSEEEARYAKDRLEGKHRAKPAAGSSLPRDNTDSSE